MQADAALVAGLVALVAAHGAVEFELAVLAIGLHPLRHHLLALAGVVLLPGLGMAQLFGIFGGKQAQLFGVRRVALLAVAQALGQALGQDSQKRIGKVERVHAHVHQAGDGLGRRVGVQGGEH